jgi:hypothetical protein
MKWGLRSPYIDLAVAVDWETFTINMATSILAETMENMQHSMWHVPRRHSYNYLKHFWKPMCKTSYNIIFKLTLNSAASLK